MRHQAIGRLFFVGLMVIATSVATWAGPPVPAAGDEVALEAPGLPQSEPPPALSSPPPPRPDTAKPVKPARTARPARSFSFMFFNPRNPRNTPSSSHGSPGKSESVSVLAAAPAAKIAWQKDFKLAHKQALDSHKPLLVVFGTVGCPGCRKMEREVLSRPEIIEQIQQGFVPVHLDADQNQSLTELLDVEVVPTALVLDTNLEIVKRVDGFQPARTLSAALKSSIAAREQKVRPASLEETSEVER